MLLKPKKSPSAMLKTVYKEAWQNVVVTSRSDPSRLKNLRCSQLPFCSLDFFVSVATNARSRFLDMRGLYYTSVGTAVHEVMQTALMQQSKRIVGDWKCLECGNIEKLTTQPECCGFPMAYEELAIDFKGIQGHVDTVFCLEETVKKNLKQNTFSVVDYKTTSMANREAMAANPPEGYKEQVLSYAKLLQLQYGLNVTHTMLVFVPRDNPDPKNITIWEKAATPLDMEKIESNLKSYLKAHRRVRKITTIKGLRKLYETYGTCKGAFCETCRSSNPWAVLENAFANNKHKLPLDDHLQTL